MRSLLDFIYTGGVTIPEARLESFLKAAETLNVTVLRDTGLHTRHHQMQQHEGTTLQHHHQLPAHQHHPGMHQQHQHPARQPRQPHPARILTPCPWASPRPPPRRPQPHTPTYVSNH
ncbi:hypothetical protein AAG570_008496 [Ranatra chinensis]|uniref:BTB domain-containing protein n=1 Tax=Ranatra chinensis TaxID=642074 RepID=A0ABD0Z1U1_9HEMI